MATCEAFDVVVVPFPFTDQTAVRRRPALVLSDGLQFNQLIGHAVMAMITSQRNSPWPLDVPISNLPSAGLSAPSMVRMKLFTLDGRLILRKAGRLAKKDAAAVRQTIRTLLQTVEGQS